MEQWKFNSLPALCRTCGLILHEMRDAGPARRKTAIDVTVEESVTHVCDSLYLSCYHDIPFVVRFP